MSVIERIRRERELLASAIEQYPGIRKIVENDLYPDTAHFIYELLQNAEDTGAFEATFVLSDGALIFEHNGRPFDESDIRGITNIGEGTKAEDEGRIGRFGIGFKSVFNYTETPRIWSPTYAFEIRKTVLPWKIPSNPDLGDRTRFEFLFNSGTKPQAQAFSEVRDGLLDISNNTLLFLSNIEEIQWRVVSGEEGRLLRITHSDHHIEILRETDGRSTESAHFLRFTDSVKGPDSQCVAIAFELEPLSNTGELDVFPSFAERFRIVPAERGCVAVYFTAEKETSNLRFHLHAPFISELSRASVKDTPTNQPLFQNLGELSARSLCKIHHLGLLDREFLSVLPNSHDNIPDRYSIIRNAIVDAMNKQSLTPTHFGDHAPAGQLLQGEAGLKNLLSRDDIRFLRYDDGRNDWAVGSTQRNNRIDRFLNDLNIRQWGIEGFVETLEELGSDIVRPWYFEEDFRKPSSRFLEWMSRKPTEWHRMLYALLRGYQEKSRLFKDMYIVRCSDGEVRKGPDCYFPTSETEEHTIFHLVAVDTFTGGGTETDKKRAREFLQHVGVREIGECERVKAILEQQYKNPDQPPPWKNHEGHLRRFMDLTEEDPTTASLFREYFIFQRADGYWSLPSKVYLDTPYLDTGLKAYYSRFHPEVAPLSDSYRNAIELINAHLDKDIYESFSGPNQFTRFANFAKKCGVIYRLEVSEVTCTRNPNAEYLYKAPGSHVTDTEFDRDYVIDGLANWFEKPTVALSRLVWNTLRDRSGEILTATYRLNQSNPSRTTDSQLVHQLREVAWVPQEENQFVRPAEASWNLLPDGFLYERGLPWLSAIQFGAKTELDKPTQAVRKALGFNDEAALADAQKFARLPKSIRRKLLEENLESADLPQRKPSNPSEREQKTREEAQIAPERITEIRPTSISVNRDQIKRESTAPYLRDQYTNDYGVTICQVCQDSLPFKLSDGKYFFEAVEFFRNLKKHYYQNYLALCPNHAAMFKYANGSEKEMKDRFKALDDKGMKLILAGKSASLYFTKIHAKDLKGIIDVDDR